MKTLLRVLTVSTLSLFLLITLGPGVAYAAIPQNDLDAILNDTVEYVPNVGNACTVSGGGGATAASGSSVYILGDSITVRTTPDYKAGFQAKGISATISARVGRSWDRDGQDEGDNVGTQGPAKTAVDTDKDAIKAAGSIVIALGTNLFAAANPIDEIYTKIRSINPTAPIWWVNVADVTNYTPGVVDFDTKLDQAAPGKFTVIPWAKTVDPDGDGTHNSKNILQDGTHPWVGGPPSPVDGTKLLSDLVVGAVTGSATTSSPTPVPASTGGCSCKSGATGVQAITGADAQQMAYNWFSSSEKGLTSIQAAAIVGNLMRESGLNPTIVNTQPPPGSGAYGLGQWLPDKGGRLDHMRAWTASKGLDPASVNGQLQFIYYESTQRDSRTYPGTKEWDGLKKMTSLEESVKYWEHNFERADDPPDGIAKRVGFANDTLTKYGSGAGAGGGGVSSPSCAVTSQSTSTTFNYEDTARGRKFKTTVFIPNGAGPFPVVMFGHGFQKGPDAYARYIQAIANKGYVVVAPSFPNADEHGILPLNRPDSLPKQPADIKFVLDQILKEPGLQGKIKTDSIAMVGHSDGADDALMVGYSAEKDARFKVVVSVGADDISSQLSSGPPLLMMHGEKDKIANHNGDLNNFKKIAANPKHFFTMLGGDHGVPGSWVDAGSDDTPALDTLTTGFLDMELNGKPDTLKATADQFSGKVKEEQ